MDDILIWAGRPEGNDPTSHFWYEQSDRSLIRLCDDAPWLDEEPESDYPDDVFLPCRPCKEIYLEDILHGLRVLNIQSRPLPRSRKQPPSPVQNGMHSPNYTPSPVQNGIYSHKKRERSMPKISITDFAKFYEARPHKQVTVVRDIRTQFLNPDDYPGRDYYRPLRHLLRYTHWRTTRLDSFEDSLDHMLGRQKNRQRREHYRTLGEAYLEFWRQRAVSFFPVPPIELDLFGLTILVRPEVGMLTKDDDHQVLKLWFNKPRPTQQARRVLHYLMGLAEERTDQWEEDWLLGVWDVRRGNIPLPLNMPRDFAVGLSGQIAAFLQIWEGLEQQSEEAVNEQW